MFIHAQCLYGAATGRCVCIQEETALTPVAVGGVGGHHKNCEILFNGWSARYPTNLVAVEEDDCRRISTIGFVRERIDRKHLECPLRHCERFWGHRGTYSDGWMALTGAVQMRQRSPSVAKGVFKTDFWTSRERMQLENRKNRRSTGSCKLQRST